MEMTPAAIADARRQRSSDRGRGRAEARDREVRRHRRRGGRRLQNVSSKREAATRLSLHEQSSRTRRRLPLRRNQADVDPLLTRRRRHAPSRRRDVHDAEEREARSSERPRSAQHRALAQARELVRAEEGRRSALARAEETANRCSVPRAPSRRKPNAMRRTGTFIRASSAG